MLSELAARPYEQIEEVLIQLATSAGGTLVRPGELWKVVSLRDLGMHHGNGVTPTQLDRFEQTIHKVLLAVKPRYATPPKSTDSHAQGSLD
ncbi:hypothetical protein, partial [Burkholderia cenocepacia]|uniref:hypothetical protein n=1 Tax=Burkholderia cenocepacia TaxID=95486 RepID=UPI00406D0531